MRGSRADSIEAERLLQAIGTEVEEQAMFRDTVLRFLTARARVAHRLRRPGAAAYARAASAVTDETTPSMPRHPTVGRPVATAALRRELVRIGRPRRSRLLFGRARS